MSFTPFQAPLNAGYLGDAETAELFSVRAELEVMLSFEAALAEVQGDLGIIPVETATAIVDGLGSFRPDMTVLASGSARDGMVVPALVTELRTVLGEHVHHGSTSQDVIDTSAMMRLRDCVALHAERLEGIIGTVEALSERFGERETMSRTRMQQALPIRWCDRFGNWLGLLASVHDAVPQRFPVQVGGPDGTCHLFPDRALEVRLGVAERLGLTCPAHHWQVDRTPIAEIANWLALCAGALGKIGADVALLAQNEVAEVRLTGGGSSSAMAHKNNPVQAEALTALARFCAVQAGGVGQAMVHENERSGAAWSLEWMLVPALAVANGAATRTAAEMLNGLTVR